MKHVLIVDDDPNICKLLDFALQKAGFSVTIAHDGNQGLALATEHSPDVALLDVMMPGVHGYELCRRLRADPKTAHAKIIFLTARSQPIDKQEAMKAGADLFLSKPVLPSDLIQEINSLFAEAEESVAAPPEPEPQVVQAQKDVTPPAKPKGHLIVCYSPSSGVGVTALSVNLALAFALSLRAETPLVELHPTPGGVLHALGLGSESLRGNLRATGKELNWDTLLLHLVDHSSGVRVLSAPPPGSDVPPDLTAQAVSVLCHQFPLIVADASSELDERIRSALLVADLVLLVMTPEVSTVRSALRSLQELRALKYPDRQVLLIVNNTRPQAGVPVEQIVKGIKRPVFTVVPYEPNMRDTLRAGSPLILTQPRAPAAQAIGRMAVQLARGFKLSAAAR